MNRKRENLFIFSCVTHAFSYHGYIKLKMLYLCSCGQSLLSISRSLFQMFFVQANKTTQQQPNHQRIKPCVYCSASKNLQLPTANIELVAWRPKGSFKRERERRALYFCWLFPIRALRHASNVFIIIELKIVVVVVESLSRGSVVRITKQATRSVGLVKKKLVCVCVFVCSCFDRPMEKSTYLFSKRAALLVLLALEPSSSSSSNDNDIMASSTRAAPLWSRCCYSCCSSFNKQTRLLRALRS